LTRNKKYRVSKKRNRLLHQKDVVGPTVHCTEANNKVLPSTGAKRSLRIFSTTFSSAKLATL
jgi:hypothetical protein